MVGGATRNAGAALVGEKRAVLRHRPLKIEDVGLIDGARILLGTREGNRCSLGPGPARSADPGLGTPVRQPRALAESYCWLPPGV